MNGMVDAAVQNEQTAHVELVEVGARDGLQNESVVLDTRTKVDLIERLVGAGTRRIEVA